MKPQRMMRSSGRWDPPGRGYLCRVEGGKGRGKNPCSYINRSLGQRRRNPPFFPVLKVTSFIKAVWFHQCKLHFKMFILKAFFTYDVFQIEIKLFALSWRIRQPRIHKILSWQQMTGVEKELPCQLLFTHCLYHQTFLICITFKAWVHIKFVTGFSHQDLSKDLSSSNFHVPLVGQIICFLQGLRLSPWIWRQRDELANLTKMHKLRVAI